MCTGSTPASHDQWGLSDKGEGTHSQQQRVFTDALDGLDEEALQEQPAASRVAVANIQVLLELRVLLTVLVHSRQRVLLVRTEDLVHLKVVRLPTLMSEPSPLVCEQLTSLVKTSPIWTSTLGSTFITSSRFRSISLLQLMSTSTLEKILYNTCSGTTPIVRKGKMNTCPDPLVRLPRTGERRAYINHHFQVEDVVLLGLVDLCDALLAQFLLRSLSWPLRESGLRSSGLKTYRPWRDGR